MIRLHISTKLHGYRVHATIYWPGIVNYDSENTKGGGPRGARTVVFIGKRYLLTMSTIYGYTHHASSACRFVCLNSVYHGLLTRILTLLHI